MAFQNWVAFVRNALPDIFAQKHFICPMVGCEHETFDNIQSCLQHIDTCPRLSDAWYWCPYCHEKENFAAPVSTSKYTIQESGRKKTKVERAVLFFKHFGVCRSSSRPETTLSTPSHKNGPFNRWIMNWVMKRRCRNVMESDAKPSYPQHCGELEDKCWEDSIGVRRGFFTDMQDHLEQHEPLGELHGTSARYELMATLGLRSELENPEPGAKPRRSSCKTWNAIIEHPNPMSVEGTFTGNITDEALTADVIAERLTESWVGIMADQDMPDYHELISPISPELTLRDSTFTPFTELVSPVSSTECFIPDESPRSPPRRPVLSISTSFGFSVETRIAQDIGQTHEACAQDPEQCFNHSIYSLGLTSTEGQQENLSLEDDFPTATILVKHVREVVHVLNDYWLHKVASIPELSLAKAPFCAASPFERGLETLRSWCRDVPPTNFANVFSLAQVAFASAYVLFQDDESYPWDELYEDVQRWRFAITNEEDRNIFSRIAHNIWSPPRLPSALRQGLSDSHHPSNASLFAQSQDWLKLGSESLLFDEHVHEHTPMQFNASLPPPTGLQRDTSVLPIVKTGRAFSICCRFLDGSLKIQFLFPVPSNS